MSVNGGGGKPPVHNFRKKGIFFLKREKDADILYGKNMYFVKNLVIKNILPKTYVLDDSESESLEYGYRKTLKKTYIFWRCPQKTVFAVRGGGF